MEEYYQRFRAVLREALVEGRVEFPKNIQKNYSDIVAYRMVRYTEQKKEIVLSDFESQVERGVPGLTPDDYSDIKKYSCSLFCDDNEAMLALHLPRRNKKLAKGEISDIYGPCIYEEDTSHVHLFLYDGVDPSGRFEVI